jgi:hypothetical protein
VSLRSSSDANGSPREPAIARASLRGAVAARRSIHELCLAVRVGLFLDRRGARR